MLKKTLAAIGGAAILAMMVTSPVLAQVSQPPTPDVGSSRDLADSVLNNARATRGNATRVEGSQNIETSNTTNNNNNRNRNRNSAPAAAPTPEANIAAAQALASAASVSCQVTQANLLGQTADGASSYEAACATGPGYVFIGSTPPQAVDCVLLSGQADIDRARNPAADVGTQCVIPQNTDVVRVIAAYAAEAGVNCNVDQGASIGKSSDGNLIYEVGCSGVDGFWLERLPSGWNTTECAVIATQNATCRFSTPAEAVATLKSRVAGSEAATCDVTEGRYMGANANGSFYEAKCGAGNGVIVRFNPAFAVQQVYPCETAHRIGGGCRLTVVPPEATPAA